MNVRVPPLLYIATALIVGIALGRLGEPWLAVLWLAVGLAAALLVGRRLPLPAAVVVASLIVAGLGLWRGWPSPANAIPAIPPDITAVRGAIADWPTMRERDQAARLTTVAVERGGVWHDIQIDLDARLPLQPRLALGDDVEARGVVRGIAAIDNEQLASYLIRQGAAGQLVARRISIVAHHPVEGMVTWRATVIRAINRALERALPASVAGLAAGVLLGERGGLSPEFRAAFTATGTSHLLVVSGWNVTLVVGVVAWLATRLRVRGSPLGLLMALLAIAGYTVLVGADPAVIRAALMGGVAVVALSFGRTSDPLVSLVVAAAAMLAIHPVLIVDLGFQLSAMATLGLVLVLPPLQPWLRRLPPLAQPPAEALAGTMAAIVAVQPLLTQTFGSVSLIAPIANVFTAPWVPLVMIGSLVVASLGVVGGQVLGEPFVPIMSDLAGWATTLVAAPMLWTVEFGASLPLATISVPAPPPFVTGAIYAVLALLALPLLSNDPVAAARHGLHASRAIAPIAGVISLAFAAGFIWFLAVQ